MKIILYTKKTIENTTGLLSSSPYSAAAAFLIFFSVLVPKTVSGIQVALNKCE